MERPTSARPQGQFVLTYLTVRNIGNQAQTFDGSSQFAFDAQGHKFSADTDAALYVDQSNAFLKDINPGNTVKGIVAFDVPKTTNLTQLELHDSPFSGGAKVSLK